MEQPTLNQYKLTMITFVNNEFKEWYRHIDGAMPSDALMFRVNQYVRDITACLNMTDEDRPHERMEVAS